MEQCTRILMCLESMNLSPSINIFISVVCVQTYSVVMSCSSLNMTVWMFL